MRRSFGICHVALSLAMMLLMVFSSDAFAQKKSRPVIKINKIYCESVKTPLYKGAEETVKDHWGRFVVKFDVQETGTKDDWLDSVVITWKILATDTNTKKIGLYSLSVTYEDVEKGNGHAACVFLKPHFMKRFGRSNLFQKGDYSMYVEISVNDQKIASETDLKSRHNGVPKNWYKEEGNAEGNERYLIPKSKTPFAGFDYDFYENEKVSD